MTIGLWRCGESNLALRVSAGPAGPKLSVILGVRAFPVSQKSV